MFGSPQSARLVRQVHLPLLAVLIAAHFVMCAGGCAPVHNSSLSEQEETATVPNELEDGIYSCDASNSTLGNGPYSLECEKSGDTILLNFDNGGHIELDIDSQDTTDGDSWEIEATHSATGDSWSLTIDK